MQHKDSRWQQRFENYIDALKTIAEVTPRYKQLNELEKDGLIQRFEFTFDLAWKVMQDYLAFLGYKDIKEPRSVITQMAQNGALDPFIWDDILLARNELSNTYDEQKSRDYLDKIIFNYYPALLDFRNEMQTKL